MIADSQVEAHEEHRAARGVGGGNEFGGPLTDRKQVDRAVSTLERREDHAEHEANEDGPACSPPPRGRERRIRNRHEKEARQHNHLACTIGNEQTRGNFRRGVWRFG